MSRLLPWLHGHWCALRAKYGKALIFSNEPQPGEQRPVKRHAK